MNRFPTGFVWGAATAAYQIEGAADEDGRGPSIWDTFCAQPGRTLRGETGAVACDHYHRLEEDLRLIADLKVGAYRFSVAWPRIQPDTSGAVNQKGLDHYRRLVDGLRRYGIRPVVTLYHWDLPQWLEDRGGWVSRDTAYRFGEYAELVADALGDEADSFITVNEPWVSAWLGYGWGDHAPGRRDFGEALAATHHLLLGHGVAVSAIRAGRPEARIGIALNYSPVRPATDSPADRVAADLIDGHYNRLFLDPVLRASYPDEVLRRYQHLIDLSFVEGGDLATIAAPIDFLGVNYYRRVHATAEERYPDPLGAWELTPAGLPVTAMGWPVEPDGLRESLLRLNRDYRRIPLYVTENGAAFDDHAGPDGRCADPERIAYLRDHLHAMAAAVAEGADVRGYFVWSLMDNFEWALGYSKRFGLYHVDYATQRRTPKDSALWYRGVAESGAVPW